MITWSNYLTCFQLIEISNNGILGFKKVLINCQKRTDGFWQLIMAVDQNFNNVILSYFKILINWKVSKNSIKWSNMYKFIIKTFDQLKKHNFDQVNFGQTTPCHRSLLHGLRISSNLSFLATQKNVMYKISYLKLTNCSAFTTTTVQS